MIFSFLYNAIVSIYRILMSVDIAVLSVYLGMAVTLSWIPWNLAAAQESTVLTSIGYFGFAISALLMNVVGIDTVRASRETRTVRQTPGHPGQGHQEGEEEEEEEEEEYDDGFEVDEMLSVFSFRSFLGRSNVNRGSTIAAVLAVCVSIMTILSFAAQHGAENVWIADLHTIVTQSARLIMVAMLEEIGIRGVVLRRLRRVMPFVWANGLTGLLWATWHFPLFAFAPGYVCTPADCGSAKGFHIVALVGHSLMIGLVSEQFDFALVPAIAYRAVEAVVVVSIGNTPYRPAFDLINAEVLMVVYVVVTLFWRPVAINSSLKRE